MKNGKINLDKMGGGLECQATLTRNNLYKPNRGFISNKYDGEEGTWTLESRS